MTLAAQTRTTTHAANGISTAFPVPFYVDSALDLAVTLIDVAGVRTALGYPGDFSIGLANQDAGGTLTTTIAHPSGKSLEIVRRTQPTQGRDVSSRGALDLAQIEGGLDRAHLAIQDLAGEAVRVQPSEAGFMLPTRASRKNRLAIFPTSGDLTYDDRLRAKDGKVAVGALADPTVTLDAGGATDAIRLPVGVTGQRPAAALGLLRGNSETGGLEAYYGDSWRTFPPTASLADFLLAGAIGAVARPVAAKLADVVSVRDFGAVGDSTTNDAAAIQAAIDHGQVSGKAVFIPDAEPRGTGLRGYYRCNSALRLYDNTRIFGQGMYSTELRFLADTDGFVCNDVNIITSSVSLENLFIRGNADVAAVATATCGLRIAPANFMTLRNLYVQDFVDGIRLDATTLGWALAQFHNVTVSLIKYPNPANGYPRYGLTLTGDTKKPQGVRFEGVIYGQLTTKAQSYNGTGSLTDFDFTLPGTTKLWKQTGIKVYQRNLTTNRWVTLAAGVDYTLYHLDTGPEVTVSPGASNVNRAQFRIRFGAAPGAGTGNIKIVYNDPTLLRCVNIEKGSGNEFKGLFGGGESIFYTDDVNNRLHPSYIQLGDKGFQLGAGASFTDINVNEISDSTVDTVISRNAAALRCKIARDAPRRMLSVNKETDQTITATAFETVTFDGPVNHLAHPCYFETGREVRFEGDVTLIEAVGATVSADVKLEVSVDHGSTWAILDFQRIRSTNTGATAVTFQTRVALFGDDSSVVSVTGGNVNEARYRVQAQMVTGDSITFNGAGSARCVLRSRDVNPL